MRRIGFDPRFVQYHRSMDTAPEDGIPFRLVGGGAADNPTVVFAGGVGASNAMKVDQTLRSWLSAASAGNLQRFDAFARQFPTAKVAHFSGHFILIHMGKKHGKDGFIVFSVDPVENKTSFRDRLYMFQETIFAKCEGKTFLDDSVVSLKDLNANDIANRVSFLETPSFIAKSSRVEGLQLENPVDIREFKQYLLKKWLLEFTDRLLALNEAKEYSNSVSKLQADFDAGSQWISANLEAPFKNQRLFLMDPTAKIDDVRSHMKKISIELERLNSDELNSYNRIIRETIFLYYFFTGNKNEMGFNADSLKELRTDLPREVKRNCY